MAKIYGNRWEIVRTLRPGGQAETFVVIDTSEQGPKTEMVLKRIRNVDRHQRFRDEVKSLESISHPNVVRLIDSDIEGAKPYLVMEFCVGGSLDDHPSRWANDPVHTIELFAEICDGVAAAHANGITHRDIKPANILLRGYDGPPVVADFGIAFIHDGERQTLTDEAVGARRFTAPELADGRADQVSQRTDVYSLGKLLYWMLNRGKVFDREQHRDPKWDLSQREESRPEFEHVNRMLDNMIVANPSSRFGTGEIAAGAARTLAKMLRDKVRVLGQHVPQPCAFCGQGHYQSVLMNDASDTRNLGITPVASSDWKALVCNTCGNLQLFRPDMSKSRSWWGPVGTLLPYR